MYTIHEEFITIDDNRYPIEVFPISQKFNNYKDALKFFESEKDRLQNECGYTVIKNQPFKSILKNPLPNIFTIITIV